MAECVNRAHDEIESVKILDNSAGERIGTSFEYLRGTINLVI